MKRIFNMMMASAIAAFTFTACEDVPEPYTNPYDKITPDEPEVVIEPAGSGTAEDPYNIVKALEVCQEVGEGGTTENVYARGIITSISELAVYDPVTSQGYGNATFLIADNNSSSTLTVYRAYSLNNEKFTKNDEIAEGDTVVICGKLVNFRGNTPEFTQGCYVYSIKKGQGGGSETPETPGTVDKPLTVAEALAYTTALAADKQSPVGYVKGKICAIKEVDTGQYGNATYSISDDGSEDNALQIYRGYSLGGEKFKASDEIKVGDEVIITGKLVNYKGNTPQFAQGSSIYSLNGQTSGGQGGGTGDAVGSKDAPKTVAEALAAVDALDNGATTEKFWYVKGKVKQVITAADKISQYKNIDYLITDDGNNEIKVFRGKNLDNTDFTSADQLQVDDEVVVYGQLMKYEDTKNNKIVPEVAQGNYLVKRTTGGSEGGGEGDKVTSLTNGDFESWADGVPTGWKSACTASSATLEQSTDAHGGSYSVNVNGNESSNKRLASQEITLAAGTYTFSFWAKATTSDVSQARPGFVPVTDGSVGSYVYSNEYATLSTSWQKVSYEFTLTAETTVCLVVMNPKKSSYSSGKDILIDDASLTKK